MSKQFIIIMSTKKNAGDTAKVDVIQPQQPGTGIEPITPHVEIMTVDDTIKQETAKFDTNLKAVNALVKKYSGLTITDIDDKDGYEAVDTARKEIKNKAIAVEKRVLVVTEDYKKIVAGVTTYSKTLSEPLRKLEAELKTKQTTIDELKEQHERELQEAAQKALNDRITLLEQTGLKFTGSYYSIGDTISIDVQTISLFNDEEFDLFVTRVANEKTRLDEIEAKRLQEEKEERERVEREKQELQEQQNKLQRDREELERGQMELREAQNQIRTDRNNRRRQTLLDAGFNYDYVLYPGAPSRGDNGPALIIDTESGKVVVDVLELESDEPTAWDNRVATALTLAREIQQKEDIRLQEIEELKQRSSNRVAQLETLDFHKVDNGYFFKNQTTKKQISVLNDDIDNQSPAEWEQHLKQLRQFITTEEGDAKKLIEEQNKQAEKLRKEGLNDWERVAEYVGSLRVVKQTETPVLKRDDTKKALDQFNRELGDLITRFEQEAEQLTK